MVFSHNCPEAYLSKTDDASNMRGVLRVASDAWLDSATCPDTSDTESDGPLILYCG